jgi:hypothetical protein
MSMIRFGHDHVCIARGCIGKFSIAEERYKEHHDMLG